MNRLRVIIRGAVQGVGFRPFVHRLATGLALQGWVSNAPEGVLAEVEGDDGPLQDFLVCLPREAPPLSFIESIQPVWLPGHGHSGFEIRDSAEAGEHAAWIQPDMATCGECRREIFDPNNRRYQYPFTNCTHCGPRFSIIEGMPYDRERTSMKKFGMCAVCQSEYDNPNDRRFHAQPNACPVCGPQLFWWDSRGRSLTQGQDAFNACMAAIRHGAIVAVKGLGGYHLMARAQDETAVRRLRARKNRPDKPFALMVPHVEVARRFCSMNPLAQRLLESSEAPIVLLDRWESPAAPPAFTSPIAVSVAPDNPRLGIMLPATPLHHLMLADLDEAMVATSGNCGEDPICHDDSQALDHLSGIADYYLVHDRPIVRPVDDSVVAIMAGREMVLRRARGYAPWPVSGRFLRPIPEGGEPAKAIVPPKVLAMGGHLKSTVAFSRGDEIILSQHIGDLDTISARERYQKTLVDMEALLDSHPEMIAVDAHPDYASTRLAGERQSSKEAMPLVTVQHHHAHALACWAENELSFPALAVVWDGTGFGMDGTIWGGEFLRLHEDGFDRVTHWRTFPLLGGDVAAREPRRSALGCLWEIFGPRALTQLNLASVRAFSQVERNVLGVAFKQHLGLSRTSSAGRLFDAVASLLDLRQTSSFEGQAAMALEFLAIKAVPSPGVYPFGLADGVVDWEPLLRALLEDLGNDMDKPVIAAKVHHTFVEVIVAVAKQVDLKQVILTGGCFQNRLLLERAVSRLHQEGFHPAWPQRVPPNDGGIALGQVVAAWQTKNENSFPLRPELTNVS